MAGAAMIPSSSGNPNPFIQNLANKNKADVGDSPITKKGPTKGRQDAIGRRLAAMGKK